MPILQFFIQPMTAQEPVTMSISQRKDNFCLILTIEYSLTSHLGFPQTWPNVREKNNRKSTKTAECSENKHKKKKNELKDTTKAWENHCVFHDHKQ